MQKGDVVIWGALVATSSPVADSWILLGLGAMFGALIPLSRKDQGWLAFARELIGRISLAMLFAGTCSAVVSWAAAKWFGLELDVHEILAPVAGLLAYRGEAIIGWALLYARRRAERAGGGGE